MEVEKFEVVYTAEPHKAQKNRKKCDGLLELTKPSGNVKLFASDSGDLLVHSSTTHTPLEGECFSLKDGAFQIEVCDRVLDHERSSASTQQVQSSTESVYQCSLSSSTGLNCHDEQSQAEPVNDVWSECEQLHRSCKRKKTICQRLAPSVSRSNASKWFAPPARPHAQATGNAASANENRADMAAYTDEHSMEHAIDLRFDASAYKALRRQQPVADSFTSLAHLKECLLAALDEELQLKILDVSNAVFNATKSLDWNPSPEQVKRALGRTPHVRYCPFAKLQRLGGRRLFLSVAQRHRPCPNKAFSLGDLWAVSSCARFASPPGAIYRSLAYGFAGDVVAVQSMSEDAENLSANCSSAASAIHLGSFQTELLIRDSLVKLRSPECKSVQLLNHILASPTHIPDTQAHELQLTDTIATQLNDAQMAVFKQLAGFISSKEPAVALLRGAFGSGKTVTIAQLIAHWRQMNRAQGNCQRVLVVTHSNAAVDQLLLQLLEIGGVEDAICRIGAQEKMHPSIKPYSAKSGDDILHEDVKEIKQELNEEVDPKKVRRLQKDLDQLQRERSEHRIASRSEQAASAFVVGTTIASCSNDALAGQSFDACIIDEASQLIEAAAITPLIRCECKRLLLIGDPAQLPPVTARATSTQEHDFSRSAFSRMQKLGFPVYFLNTTMRCHPAIASIANDVFYIGELQIGIGVNDREPLIQNMPPVSFIECQVSVKQTAKESYSTYDPDEASTVRSAVSRLVYELEPWELGVIAFYTAQRNEIQRVLKDGEQGEDMVEVNTVDAFQGSSKKVCSFHQ